MAVAAPRCRAELQKRQWKERETSPERTKVWSEPKPRTAERKVPVVYYLSRNGQLEHPHFMEVSLSSTHGLYLRDVINRLNFLRGKGMASMYSWSSKRSYKNGFVWHDLSEDDFIYPAHGHEYVLKGSELLHGDVSPASQGTTVSSSSSDRPPDSDLPLVRRNKTPWSSLDLNEYKVYKTDLTSDSAAKAAADASTQTEDRTQRRRALPISDEQRQTEIGSDEISPPPSSSSSETLETLMKSDGRGITVVPEDQDRTVGTGASGRMRASAVLINLISCGSISVKDHVDLSAMAQYKRRTPPGKPNPEAKQMEGLMETPRFLATRLEDKEYFSGSLIETKNKGRDGGAAAPALKRSSSYNADRSSKLELVEEESKGMCFQRKTRPAIRRDSNASFSRSTNGDVSKRMDDDEPAFFKARVSNSQE